MVFRRILAGTFALAVAMTTACSPDDTSSPESLPDGPALIRAAADAAGGITSTRLDLRVDGTLPGVSVRSIDAGLTRAGEATGSGTIKQAGHLVEIEFVLTGDTLYLKGPTGGYQEIPAAFSSSVYDPSAVLDPERGVAKLLSSLREPRTVGAEELDGVRTYKISGKLPADVLSSLVPGVRSNADITFWVRGDDSRLPVKASASLKDGATVDIRLSEINKPVTVKAPA